jgi:hypothetical protein
MKRKIKSEDEIKNLMARQQNPGVWLLFARRLSTFS